MPTGNKKYDETLFEFISKASVGSIMLMRDYNFACNYWCKPETMDNSHPF